MGLADSLYQEIRILLCNVIHNALNRVTGIVKGNIFSLIGSLFGNSGKSP